MRILVNSIRSDYDAGLSVDSTGIAYEILDRATLILFLVSYINVFRFEKLINQEVGRCVMLQTQTRKQKTTETTLLWFREALGFVSVDPPEGRPWHIHVTTPTTDVIEYLDKILPKELDNA